LLGRINDSPESFHIVTLAFHFVKHSMAICADRSKVIKASSDSPVELAEWDTVVGFCKVLPEVAVNIHKTEVTD